MTARGQIQRQSILALKGQLSALMLRQEIVYMKSFNVGYYTVISLCLLFWILCAIVYVQPTFFLIQPALCYKCSKTLRKEERKKGMPQKGRVIWKNNNEG